MMTRHCSRTRRDFLQLAGMAAGAALVLPYRSPVLAQSVPIQTVRLSAKLALLRGPDANVLIAKSDDGIIMVDGGHADWSAALLKTTSEVFPGIPIAALFNTHWHAEQTGSNLVLGEQGVQIIAHENTRLWLSTEVWVRWSDRKYPPLPAQALPNKTFYDSGDMKIAEQAIQYGYMLNAHTDGDIYIHFPEENVLVTGGLVANDGWPLLDWWTGGWTGGMLAGYAALLEVANENTRIIPASGPAMSFAQLQAQQEMYRVVFDRIHNLLVQSKDIAEVLAAGTAAEYEGQLGKADLFVTLAFQSLWGHLRDGTQNGVLPRMY